MHGAPSVTYPVGRSRYAERLLLGLWIAGAVGVAGACLSSDAVDFRTAVLVLSALVAGLAAWTGLVRSNAQAALVFDGEHWSIGGRASLGTARAGVALDLQSLLLVRLTGPAGRSRWVWVDRHAMPERWRDLRRALYSRAPAAGAQHSLP